MDWPIERGACLAHAQLRSKTCEHRAGLKRRAGPRVASCLPRTRRCRSTVARHHIRHVPVAAAAGSAQRAELIYSAPKPIHRRPDARPSNPGYDPTKSALGQNTSSDDYRDSLIELLRQGQPAALLRILTDYPDVAVWIKRKIEQGI